MRFISHLILTINSYISEIYIGDESFDIIQLLDIKQTKDLASYKAECYFLYEGKYLHIELILKNKKIKLLYEFTKYEPEYDLLITNTYDDEYMVVKNI
jgi:hypothetical protein